MYNPKCQIPALRFSNQHNYKLLWEREKEKGITVQITLKISSSNRFSVAFTAAGSKGERQHTQMQDIKSLLLFLGNCGPVPMDLDVSTMKPEVTKRECIVTKLCYIAIQI